VSLLTAVHEGLKSVTYLLMSTVNSPAAEY